MIAILGYIEKKTLLDYSLNTQKGRRACSECARERERERERKERGGEQAITHIRTQVVRMGDVREQAEIGAGDEELDAALEMELAASFPLFQPNPNSSPFSENERCRTELSSCSSLYCFVLTATPLKP